MPSGEHSGSRTPPVEEADGGCYIRPLFPGEYEKPGYGEAVAWFKKEDKSTTFYVRADKMVGLSGDTLKKHALGNALEEAGVLIHGYGRNRTHSRLPDGEQVQHYRLTFAEEAEYEAF